MSAPGAEDPSEIQPEILHGGVANAGAVVRLGHEVRRPSNAHTPTIHAFLRHLRDAGFTGASNPVGIDDEGRERMDHIAGEVPIPPYPAWAQSDEALASVARLIRRLHDASAQFVEPDGATWSGEMADPRGGTTICHNDVCLENVVFRDGIATALIDFDFAAPGHPVYDLSQFARMCVPVDDDESAARLAWAPNDKPRRLRLVADAYGLDERGRAELLDVLAAGIARGGEFVLRRVREGDANFIEMWDDMGGMARFDRRRAWFAGSRELFRAAME